jgi:DNA mismatch repair ATPase MutS
MKYRVETGAVDRSYGIFVLKMLGFNKNIVEKAEKMAERLESFLKVEGMS